MELISSTNSPLKGKCLSCIDATVSLVPCDTSLKALSTFCLVGKVVAPMIVDKATIRNFAAKSWKFPVSIVALSEVSKNKNCFEFGYALVEDRKWALDNGPCNRVSFPLFGSWLSTSSTYLDVFLGANTFTLNLTMSKKLVPGFTCHRLPLAIAGASHDDNGGFKGMAPNGSRFSRQSKMVTNRAIFPVGTSHFLSMQNGSPSRGLRKLYHRYLVLVIRLMLEVMGPDDMPILDLNNNLKVDRVLITEKEKHLNIFNKKNVGQGFLSFDLANGSLVSSIGPSINLQCDVGPLVIGVQDHVRSPIVINDVDGEGPKGCGPRGSLGQDNLEKMTILMVTNSKSSSVCGQEVNFQHDEEKALSNIFQAQDTSLQDLKQFRSLDLYEIREIGVFSRPSKLLCQHPDVVRDFPWDTNIHVQAPIVVVEESSNDNLNSISCSDDPNEGISNGKRLSCLDRWMGLVCLMTQTLLVRRNLIPMWRRMLYLLYRSHERFGGSWLILRDNNFVLSESKRVGSKGRDLFIPFISNLVNSTGLINLHIQGDKLTWDNHSSSSNHVKSTLDKGLVNGVWIKLFPRAILCSSQTCNSNHRPIFILSGGVEEKFKRCFKFEEGWTRDDRSKLVVDSAWNSVIHFTLGPLAGSSRKLGRPGLLLCTGIDPNLVGLIP
uniref:Uncharacterized protein n=1 Tax=Cannabis sativa TaxID=3483 RepID=A0A803PKF0_CANSA